jgi:hypothetical protein
MLELEKIPTMSETEIRDERDIEISKCKILNCCHKMFRYDSEGLRSRHQLDPDGDYFCFDFDESRSKEKEFKASATLLFNLREHFEKYHNNSSNETLPNFIKREIKRRVRREKSISRINVIESIYWKIQYKV